MFTRETGMRMHPCGKLALSAVMALSAGASNSVWAQFTGISQAGYASASLSSSGAAGANYSDDKSLSNLPSGTQSIYARTSGSSASLGTTVSEQLISMGGSSSGSSYTQYNTDAYGTRYPVAVITGSGSSGANVTFTVLAATPATFSLSGLAGNDYYLYTLDSRGWEVSSVRNADLLQITSLLPGTYKVGRSGGPGGWGLTLSASAVPEAHAQWAWLTGCLLMAAAVRRRQSA